LTDNFQIYIMAINIELEKLYYDDVEERKSVDLDNKDEVVKIGQRTITEINQVKHMLATNLIDLTEIWNLHYLAYILQHSENSSDYKLANKFASEAVRLGSTVSKWIYAATLDRCLIAEGKKQKYGTQYKLENGKWITQPVDESTTDEEREDFGVKTLKEYLSTQYK